MDVFWAALVELVAVVVGILMALWLNGWNQRRIRGRQEAEYLDSLRADISADVEALRQQMAWADGTAEAARTLLRVVRGEEQVGDSTLLLRTLKRAGTMYPFRPTRTTFQELLGSGNLSIIEDREVLRSVIAYYGAAEFPEEAARLAGSTAPQPSSNMPGAATPNWSSYATISWRMRSRRIAPFDRVVAHMVLMDLPDISPLIACVRRVLRVGGRFTFTLPHPCFFKPSGSRRPGDRPPLLRGARLPGSGRMGDRHLRRAPALPPDADAIRRRPAGARPGRLAAVRSTARRQVRSEGHLLQGDPQVHARRSASGRGGGGMSRPDGLAVAGAREALPALVPGRTA